MSAQLVVHEMHRHFSAWLSGKGTRAALLVVGLLGLSVAVNAMIVLAARG